MLKKILLTIPAALSIWHAEAQLINEQQMSQQNFLRRVVNIESFMARFNKEEDQRGNDVSTGMNKNKEEFIKERTYSILSLFDMVSANKAVGEEKENIIFFVKQVNSETSQAKLDFYDPNWYAEVECEAEYKKQKKKVTLILKNQKVASFGSKWVIQSAYADFLTAGPPAKETAAFIPPNSHGTDFIGVPGILNEAKNITLFTADDYRPDPCSMFLYAMHNQDLVLKETTQVRYHLLQINGWVLQIKEFNRNTQNSGWLIYKLIKIDENNKKNYLKNLLTGGRLSN